METSRDDSPRTCAQCGTPLADRHGGGRRADYCSRACQAKAYRVRHAETSRDESQWSALTARAVAAEAEAASLREQLAAALLRAAELAAELANLRTTKSTTAARQTTKTAAPGSPALPPQITLSTPRRYEQTGPSAWTVHVGDVPIGNIRHLSGKYWPTLPNGVEVYLGSVADNLDEAADKLARGYNGWANYWHAETTARLVLLRPQRDGARTVKWAGSTIGKVTAAAGAGLGGEGIVAVTPKAGMLRVNGSGPTRFDDEQQAAEALLTRWRTDNPPPWGELVARQSESEPTTS